MKRRNTRLIAGIFAAAVMLGAIAGCGQGSEPEPTTDIQATIDAAVRAATPTETPISEPTATTEPTVAPTPDLAATVAAMVAAADQPTAMAATPTPETQPEPTAMPAEPTAPVDPTATADSGGPDRYSLAYCHSVQWPAVLYCRNSNGRKRCSGGRNAGVRQEPNGEHHRGRHNYG